MRDPVSSAFRITLLDRTRAPGVRYFSVCMGFKHLPASTEFCELFSQSQRAVQPGYRASHNPNRRTLFERHAVRGVADKYYRFIDIVRSSTAILILIVLVQNYRTDMPTDLP